MGLASFIAAHNGQYVQAAGGLGGQCVDLANVWLIASGKQPIRENAIDWAHATIPGWTWIANEPNNYPHAGAVVVWGEDAHAGTGADGHVALNVTADLHTLYTFDQNWGVQSCKLVAHSYAGVLGWWQPV